MQKKKEELRQDIYQAACYEFMHKGYQVASMRSIAKRANTSIGNLYHYYDSKEALLDEMMRSAILSLDLLVKEHLAKNIRVESFDELHLALDNDEMFWESGFFDILRPEIVIFLKQEEPQWTKKKEEYLQILRQHLAWHLGNVDPTDGFLKIIVNMFIESLVFVVKSNAKKQEAMEDFRRLFRMICSGIIHREDENL